MIVNIFPSCFEVVMKKQDVTRLLDQINLSLSKLKQGHAVLNDHKRWQHASFIYVPSMHELSSGNFFGENFLKANAI